MQLFKKKDEIEIKMELKRFFLNVLSYFSPIFINKILIYYLSPKKYKMC
jgi:hypothetical protein